MSATGSGAVAPLDIARAAWNATTSASDQYFAHGRDPAPTGTWTLAKDVSRTRSAMAAQASLSSPESDVRGSFECGQDPEASTDQRRSASARMIFSNSQSSDASRCPTSWSTE